MSVKHEHIRERLARIRSRATRAGVDDGFRTNCFCGESEHLNAIHDLAGSNVPWLLAIAQGLLDYADKQARIIGRDPKAETLVIDQLWQLRQILNAPVEIGDPDSDIIGISQLLGQHDESKENQQ